MKMTKKIVALLLVILLAFGFAPQVFALSIVDTVPTDLTEIISENFGYMLDSVLRDAEVYGVSAQDFESFSILNPVTFNSMDDEGSDSDTIFHFPVADKNGKICLIYDIILTENGYTATIGPDFAPLLNSAYENGTTELLLVQDEYTFYAVDDFAGYYQLGNEIADMSDSDYERLTVSTLSEDAMTVSSLTINDVYSLAAEDAYDLCVEGKADLYSTAVTGTKILSNYPIVNQNVDGKQYGLCWAATVASMVRFEKPTLYPDLTAQDVADYMGIGYDDGGTNSESKQALEHYLSGSYVPTITGVLTQAQIQTVINNIDPAYLQCRRPDGFLSYKYHAVAMFGYDFTSDYTRIQIMDPAYECYKWCTMDSSENWTFAFGSYTYTWIKTIRLLYST